MPRKPASHSEQLRKQRDDDYHRGRSDKREIAFYHTAAWLKLRRWQLRAFPLCRMCGDDGNITAGVVVDHIVPLKEAPHLCVESRNLMTLCKACHNRKTESDRKL